MSLPIWTADTLLHSSETNTHTQGSPKTKKLGGGGGSDNF